MFLKSQLTWNVVIPAENLDSEGVLLQRAILTRIMGDFAAKKASKDIGYHLAVTTLDHVGEGVVRLDSGDVLFPVSFSCITFKMLLGEVLEGTVYKVMKQCVFLRCGPAELVFLSHAKMTGYHYHYVPGEKSVFKNDEGLTIGKNVVLRFVVIAEKYKEDEDDFRVMVSLDGDFLGPVSQ